MIIPPGTNKEVKEGRGDNKEAEAARREAEAAKAELEKERERRRQQQTRVKGREQRAAKLWKSAKDHMRVQKNPHLYPQWGG